MLLKAMRLAPVFLLAACYNAPAAVSLQQAFPNLSFVNPVDFQHPGDGSDRLFVVEQSGIIYVFDNNPEVQEKNVFLDIQDRVDNSHMEEGLLGLAFHPDFENNPYFYVNYTSTNPDRSRISRFRVSESNPDVADHESELIILEVDKPYENHNAGQLVFGPADGFLYVTTGDGGFIGDPDNNAQNLSVLLGKILRIDVNTTDSSLNYAIPPDNPFASNLEGYREEIFAYGLRNPWRVSIDPATGWFWAADVGQTEWEEIDIIQSGKNYGWHIMEGRHCFFPPEDCDTTGITMPVWEYGHDQGLSVIGGYVYRGPGIPELVGKYVYGDWGSGLIWSLTYDGQNPPSNALLLDSSLQISSFGVDRLNELYLCALDGKIYRFVSSIDVPDDEQSPIPKKLALRQNYPNPFNPMTTIPFEIGGGADVPARANLTIYDSRGKLVCTLFDSTVGAGRGSVVWDGRDASKEPVSSGVYLYMLRSGKQTLTRKMLLRK
jgi:glucose/arabinose dehydrogenase